ATARSCGNCERLQRQLEAQQQTIAVLSEQVRTLQEQLASLRKDSSTSSKPPSSDIVKPPKPAPPPGQEKRKIGGQPGHPRHLRPPSSPKQINGDSSEYALDCCPDCGHAVEPLPGPPRLVQQMDVPAAPVVVSEHSSHPAWCPHCLKI